MKLKKTYICNAKEKHLSLAITDFLTKDSWGACIYFTKFVKGALHTCKVL